MKNILYFAIWYFLKWKLYCIIIFVITKIKSLLYLILFEILLFKKWVKQKIKIKENGDKNKFIINDICILHTSI